MELSKAVALITGGAQGIGKGFAKYLLNKGAKVVIADIDVQRGKSFQEECKHHYPKNVLEFVKCDVTDEEQLPRAFDIAVKKFGGLDIVCNNAGIMTADPKRSRQQVNINLTAVIEGTFLGVELMSVKNGGRGGVVVNVASAAGFQLMKRAPVYTATKQGVVAFTRSFKHLPHFAEDKVRVNCICPFFCDTAMLRKGYEERPDMKDVFSSFGLVSIDEVVEGFTRCLDDTINASAIAIVPQHIYQLSFPPARPKL